jgi:hypothetical protein
VIVSLYAGSDGQTQTAGEAFGTSCATPVVLADSASASIDTQKVPPALVGTFRPSFPLSGFTGKGPNGTWKLRFLDGGPGDSGVFQCGAVSVKPLVPSLDLNVDSAVDVYDMLELLKRYGSTTATNLAKADLNNDGQVTDTDLSLLKAGL